MSDEIEAKHEIVITGRVARLVTDDILVINRGRADRVLKGMKFSVLDPRTEDVTDPETNEPLGSIRREKTRVVVTDVEERICLARREGIGAALEGMSRAFAPRPTASAVSGAEPAWPEGVKVRDPVEGRYVLRSGGR